MAKIVNNQPPYRPNNNEDQALNFENLKVDKFIKEYSKDLSLLQNQLALFYPAGKKFYKLGMLDIRGQRFEVFGESMTRFFRFQDVILFNYMVGDDFDKYYEIYKTQDIEERDPVDGKHKKPRIKSKEKILEWLKGYEGRISHMDGYKDLLEKREQEKDERLKPKQ